jgi:hypothetical protein
MLLLPYCQVLLLVKHITFIVRLIIYGKYTPKNFRTANNKIRIQDGYYWIYKKN